MIKRSIACSLIGLLGFITSCSDRNDHQITGVWLLTTRTIDIPFDVNEDGIAHTNLLDEIDCNERETLSFDTNGMITSGNEFSNTLRFYKEVNTGRYKLNSDCNREGIISFASTYDIIEENTFKISNRVYVLSDNTLTTVYKDAVDIYNDDFSEVLETKDLKLIYTKQ
ncbi:hypothetical protein [Winogradskyella sp. PC D3.3]